ncbi:hypothetical protein PMAYCL1PPCAC_28237, partial [Pristionchus mayeri]
RFVDILTCVAILVEAVGKEGFKDDAAEILVAVSEACPTLIPEALRMPYPVPPGQEGDRLLDEWSAQRTDRMNQYLRLHNLLSSLIEHADGNVHHGVERQPKDKLRELSMFIIMRWEEVCAAVSTHVRLYVQNSSIHPVHGGSEKETAELLFDIIRNSEANADYAVQAVISLLRQLKDCYDKTDQREVWKILWNYIDLEQREKHYSENSDDLAKLLGYLEVIEKCTPIMGEDV